MACNAYIHWAFQRGSLSVTLPLHFPNTSPVSTVFSIPKCLPSDSNSRGGLGEVSGKSFSNTSPLAIPFYTAFPRDWGKWGGLFIIPLFHRSHFFCREARNRTSIAPNIVLLAYFINLGRKALCVALRPRLLSKKFFLTSVFIIT